MSKSNEIKLNIGDTVFLKDMEIESIDENGNAICHWIGEDDKKYTSTFNVKSLTKEEKPFGGLMG